ncbi:MAG: coproporphyrinogen dehydrogenase HemZ [Eubacteriales bacterium]|nr:coproporphyrinogen dehydrogenase HemZ [Eubacteriales bacterium]
MTEISVAVQTPLAKLANEFCEVLKLFFKVEGFAIGDAPMGFKPLVHQFSEENGQWSCSFTFEGHIMKKTLPIPAVEDERRELIHKRHIKRLCKVTLYELLKEMTGVHPPWGSLTGIRPTRLLYERLADGMTMAQAVLAVEHDFDVTPEKAELLREIVTVQQTLPSPNPREADLYVSVPFCRTRCAYCSFPGEAVGKGKLIPPYMQAVLWELGEARRLFTKAGLKLRAVYVGGGTPTALGENEFTRLMDAVMEQFPDACEYTVEAGRPDTITPGKLSVLRRLKVGRISINPQTMNDETLRRIGRDHTAQQTVDAFVLAREMGFEDINMDVIAGLPGEKVAHFAHTMEEIATLKPDSLTVHTLAIKRSSRLNLEHAPLPDAFDAAEMVRLGGETARALGFSPYYLYRQKYMAGQQNVGYARKGAACLYNIDMMEETSSVIAVGAGAISKRVFPDRELRIERAPNVTNVSVYIDRVEEMARRKEALFL